MESKVIGQWFLMLPEKYRLLAFERYVTHAYDDASIHSIEPSFESAILNAFEWIETPEGFEFWKKVSQWDPSLVLPPIPEE